MVIENEDEKDKDGKDKDADIEEVLPITCPHCGKDFDVVIENEDGEIEVESKEEDDKERGDEKGEIDDAFMTVGLPGLGAPGA